MFTVKYQQDWQPRDVLISLVSAMGAAKWGAEEVLAWMEKKFPAAPLPEKPEGE